MFKEFEQQKYEENAVYDANININGNLEGICCSGLLGCDLASREEFAIAISDNLYSLSSYLVLIAGWQVSECSFNQTLTRFSLTQGFQTRTVH